MLAARRPPTIRRVRDWTPAPARKSAVVHAAPRREAPTRPDPSWLFREEDVATLVPTKSEIRAILAEADDATVPYVRPVVAPPPPRMPMLSTPDMQLASLVAVYEKRTDELAKGRAHARAIAAQAEANADVDPPTRQQRRKPRGRTAPPVLARAREVAQAHAYKIIFSVLCVWGTLHLLLVR